MAETISPHRRITVDEYYDMARTGLIAPDARVELIEGEVVRMAPIGDRTATPWKSSMSCSTRR
jgi:Uma2 family endonuclease